MKTFYAFLLIWFAITVTSVAQIKLLAMKGDVTVRHGASESWQQVAVGDVLKPDDSMKLGKKSSATIMVEKGKIITAPEQVIVDVSDLRNLTQEEFLLKLAMEQVRSVQLPEKDDKINIPRTTTVHGSQKDLVTLASKNPEVGVYQLNGTKILFDNGYNATGVLKTKQVYRLYPALSKQIENRVLVATAFERLNLFRDALGEYRALLKEPLTTQQRGEIEQKIEQLKQKLEG